MDLDVATSQRTLEQAWELNMDTCLHPWRTDAHVCVARPASEGTGTSWSLLLIVPTLSSDVQRLREAGGCLQGS